MRHGGLHEGRHAEQQVHLPRATEDSYQTLESTRTLARRIQRLQQIDEQEPAADRSAVQTCAAHA